MRMVKPVTEVLKVLPKAAGFGCHFHAQLTVFHHFIFLR